jgi:hypothetical protein
MLSGLLFSRNRFIGLVGGVFFVLLGAGGFLLTGGTGFFDSEGGVLFTLVELNPAQNVIHLALGVVLVITALRPTPVAAMSNAIVGTIFLALGIFGLFVHENDALNLLALSTWGNALHFASAAVLLAVGLGADRGSKDN